MSCKSPKTQRLWWRPSNSYQFVEHPQQSVPSSHPPRFPLRKYNQVRTVISLPKPPPKAERQGHRLHFEALNPISISLHISKHAVDKFQHPLRFSNCRPIQLVFHHSNPTQVAPSYSRAGAISLLAVTIRVSKQDHRRGHGVLHQRACR